MADLAFRRPTPLEPGAHVLGNFYGGPVGLAIKLNPDPLDFGTVAMDEIAKKTLTITNDDVVPFTVTSLAIKGPAYISSSGIGGTSPANFSITEDRCLDTTLGPGEYCAMEIAFVPNSSGSNGARLEYLTNLTSNSTFNPPYVALTGSRARSVADIASETPSGNASPDGEPGPRSGSGAIDWTHILVLLLGSVVFGGRRISVGGAVRT